MVLDRPGTPLRPADLPEPVPGPGQLLLDVRACGVCRTDLHVSDGEVPQTRAPLVLGHQIVGQRLDTGERVGVPWLGWTDGTCPACVRGQENLCVAARFTGKDLDGGFSAYTVAAERFCLPLGGRADVIDDVHVAPLLCAGLIGLRTLRAA